jgi:hypothetical protein
MVPSSWRRPQGSQRPHLAPTQTTLAVVVTVVAAESTLTPAASRSASRAGEAPAASAPPATRSSPAMVVEPTCTAAWGRSGAMEEDPVEG